MEHNKIRNRQTFRPYF